MIDLPSGSIVSYPYLWRWQHNDGARMPKKTAWFALQLTVPDPAREITHLVILPISGSSPYQGRAGST
jgi:hypothetical protein